MRLTQLAFILIIICRIHYIRDFKSLVDDALWI